MMRDRLGLRPVGPRLRVSTDCRYCLSGDRYQVKKFKIRELVEGGQFHSGTRVEIPQVTRCDQIGLIVLCQAKD